MIRVLVVDDDFRVARLHAEFVVQLPGFEVVGVAHTAAEATRLASTQRPQLVLLDEYLPDASGVSIIPELVGDVLMLTAADDSRTVHDALAAGAMNYLVKPFTAAQLTDRLAAYARFHTHLTVSRRLDQQEIDEAARLLRAADLPSGAASRPRFATTTDGIRGVLQQAGTPMTAVEVAEITGISRATAQRHLAALAHQGQVVLSLRYGTTGRPEHLYAWPR